MVVTRKMLACVMLLTCCGDDPEPARSDTSLTATMLDTSMDTELDSDPSTDVDVAPEVVVPTCAEGAARTWSDGPYGTHRGDRAADFSVPLTDGTTWSYRATFTGCDVVVIIPDVLRLSALDDISLWDDDRGLDDLLDRSPPDVVYLFVVNAGDVAHASAMRDRLDTMLAHRADGELWRPRLLVAAETAQALDDAWIGAALTQHLRSGIALDRDQRVRGMGTLADVDRYDPRLAAAEAWPWKENIGYAAYEAIYLQAEGKRQAALDAEDATLVTLWQDALLAEKAEVDVALPSAEVMATFDTLEVEIVSRCPDADALELGNCGAWDYLANLYVREGDADIELARAITAYHRETRWVVDASGLLPKLASGGTRHFTWSFAPSWNPQPTSTTLRLRLSKRAKGTRPVRVTSLFSGGGFGAAYNTGREPKVVAIAATTKRVELWAIITGHGAGTSQCAEFCAHQHHFTVGASTYDKTFSEANDDDACIAHASDGMVPNQGGSWWFGRGGWCPGQAVAPWVVDVTRDVVPGSEATVSYRGTLRNAEPPDGAGDIVMSSYLVEYE